LRRVLATIVAVEKQ